MISGAIANLGRRENRIANPGPIAKLAAEICNTFRGRIYREQKGRGEKTGEVEYRSNYTQLCEWISATFTGQCGIVGAEYPAILDRVWRAASRNLDAETRVDVFPATLGFPRNEASARRRLGIGEARLEIGCLADFPPNQQTFKMHSICANYKQFKVLT